MILCRPFANIADILAVNIGALMLDVVPGRVCPSAPATLSFSILAVNIGALMLEVVPGRVCAPAPATLSFSSLTVSTWNTGHGAG